MRDNLVRVFEDKRYFYDGHGRLIKKLSGKHTDQRFEWDDESRLTQVITIRRPGTEHQSTQTTKFDYDAIGRRVAKHDAFGVTRFIWEGMRLLQERRGGQVVSYVYEPDSYVPLARLDATGASTDDGGLGTTADAQTPQTAQNLQAKSASSARPASARSYQNNTKGAFANDAREADGRSWQALQDKHHAQPLKIANGEPRLCEVFYFHTDQVGLPEELTNSQGKLCWQASYKTWGNTVSEEWEVRSPNGQKVHALDEGAKPTTEQNLRFQGQYLDRETGLHYNTFRFYDPDIGRFISPDPIGLEGGINLNGYIPNPFSWIDPWGWNNVKTGAGRDHVTYSGTKGGKPYSGYASAPSNLKLTPEQIISRRYNGDFSNFGGKAPVPTYNGSGVAGKHTARGLEQHQHEQNIKQYGKKNVANAQNPVGEGNANRTSYKSHADAHLNGKGAPKKGC